MTTSGRDRSRALLSAEKSLTSPAIELQVEATPACSNKFGWVGASSAYPVTLAPRELSHSTIQPPLKPVWPVTNTFRPFQNERFSIKISQPAHAARSTA